MSQDPYGRSCSYSDCWDAPVFAVKVHRRSEPLVGSLAHLACDVHMRVIFSEYVEELSKDQDVHAVTVVLA